MEAMDFEDLALEVARLFAQEEGVRKSWQERFTYVLVDEFQDIDRGQYELLKILAAPQNNLFMVGDDDQSIYGFRGAAPEVMRQVTEDFPALQQVVLDINYRCGSRIIDCAGQLIAHNTGRFEKKAISGRGHTGEVCTWTAEDKREEWLLLAQDIRKEIEKGRKPAEIAVLTRTNRSAAGILKTLWSQGISCSWGSGKKEGTEGEKKGQSLAEHFIWKDMEAYLLLGENRRERGLYLRILNKPRRYLSREVFREAVVNREGCLAAAGEDRIGRSRLERFFQELALLQGLPPAAALYCIRRRMGYDTYLEGVAQLQHREPEELLAVMDILQKLSLGKKDLKEFKGAVKAYTWPVSEEGVRVTTLHGSKGLEYDVVYIPDVNKGNIPWNGAKSQAEVEEERRLFYVGMTRAREKLCLLWVDGEEGSRGQPSPFLEEAGVGAPSLKSIPEKERI
jgi:DNA helicase-2/ATP-dependent DNA helicase PcrA